MKRSMLPAVFALGLLGAAGCGGGATPEMRIQSLGGTVDKDANDPSEPIIAVRLVKSRFKDDDLKWIAEIPTVQLLDLSESPVTAAGLQNLAPAKLDSLYLGRSKITNDKLMALASIKGLRSLYLTNTDLTDANLEHLAGLPNLVSLNLNGSNVTDQQLEALAKLPALQALALTDTGITDKGVPHLSRMSGLTGLAIQRSRISQEGVARCAAPCRAAPAS